jgi:hypothetical protein
MQWKLTAPFSKAERGGFEAVYPPEKDLNFTATYEGKSKQAKWVDFTSQDEYGKIDFNKPFGMEKSVVGYAATDFTSVSERDAEIRIGCKNGWKVWLNGKLPKRTNRAVDHRMGIPTPHLRCHRHGDLGAEMKNEGSKI